PVPPLASPFIVAPTGEKFSLTFEDRFREKELNTNVWRPFNTEYPTFGPTHCVAGTAGCAKSEVMVLGKLVDVSGVYNTIYTPDNVETTGSGLILRGQRQPVNMPKVNDGPSALFSSGWIDTYGKYTQTYGFFEMKAKLPGGNGWWPAFWLMPQNRQWSYEIDIMEVLTGNNGNDRTNTGPNSVHLGLLWNNGRGNIGKWYKNPALDVTTGFHTYGLLWKPESLTYYVDGIAVHSVKKSEGAAIPQIPMYMIANLGVGGSWGGFPDEKTDFSQTMEIEYIRAYQYDGAPAAQAEPTFPVLIDNVMPALVTAAAGETISFDVAVNSGIETSAYSLSYTLMNVKKDPITKINGTRDRVFGTVKAMPLKGGRQSFQVTMKIPSDFPAGDYAFKTSIAEVATGKYNNGGTTAVVRLK
ncbi:MAG: glycoside hydrolase family 16 protein, partial [Proteobacteria bacterium]